jgi:acetyltransferase-like isoleucine patch superfamily enzyme
MRPGLELRLRAAVNRWRRRAWHALAYRMLFGERAPDGRALPSTRIAPSTCIEGESGLSLADHVFIGQFNFLEASGGLAIEEGVQITNFCSIVTHSTHRSIRLMGRLTAAAAGARPGDVRAPVRIGAYSYIGPHSLIEAGSVLGRGTLVAAYSRVRGEHPPFAVLRGNPAVAVGDTRERDAPWLERHPELREAYEAWAGALPAGFRDGTKEPAEAGP